jgi:t-SNARE complex subunit (syntaxin)
MRAKSMMLKAQAKKKKRRAGKKMPVYRDPDQTFDWQQGRIMSRLHRIAGPNATPRDLVLAIQASARADREWEEAHEYLYD